MQHEEHDFGVVQSASIYQCQEAATQRPSVGDTYIDQLFGSCAFETEGAINVSTLTLDEINSARWIRDISEKVSQLYIYKYRIRHDAKSHVLKYMHWLM